MKKQNILIVEDERIVAEDLRESIELLGYDVCGIAGTSEKAIALAEKHRPDIALMDIVLRGDVDGIHTANHIRKAFNIPSIFLTAYSDVKTLDRAKPCRPLGFVIKPYEIHSVRAALEVAGNALAAEVELLRYQNSLEDLVKARTVELERRVGGEHLIGQISASFVQCDSANIGQAIRNALQQVARELHLEHISIVVENEKKAGALDRRNTIRKPFNPVAEAPGAPPAIIASAELVKQFAKPDWVLNQGIHCPEVQDLTGISSTLGHPVSGMIVAQIQQADEAIGYLIAWSSEKECAIDAASRQILSGVSHAFSSVIQRARAEREKDDVMEQLFQSQKMEAIGNLTGGIAHDLNNMLLPILGYCGMLKEETESLKGSSAIVSEIQYAAESAAALTRQLLSFGKKQIIARSCKNVNNVVLSNRSLLQRVIGEEYRLVVDLSHAALNSMIDTGQIGQLLINLTINARDAMPDGGAITIRSNVANKNEYSHLIKKFDGREWAVLEIEDEGCGMPKDVVDKIFDPFFTTKGMGGTGLGLSVVHGIILQHEGHIAVESTEGVGTKFIILLPISEITKAVDVVGRQPKVKNSKGKGEMVLIVEDEPQVRKFVQFALLSNGYETIEAGDVEEAKIQITKSRQNIDLVLSDAVLPDGSGLDVLKFAQSVAPEAAFMITTGHTERDPLLNSIRSSEVAFLQKPYPLDRLLAMVRTALDRTEESLIS